MRDKAFPWGRAAPALGQASPPTGSPANGHRTECHPVRGSAGDGVQVQRETATPWDRPARCPGPSTRSWRSRAGPRHGRGDAEEALRSVLRHEEEQHPGRPPLWSSRARPLPQQRARVTSRAAGDSALSPAARSRDRASSGRRARAARRTHGMPSEGPVPHDRGSVPCQWRVQGIDVGSDGAAVPEKPLASNGKGVPTGGAGG